MSVSVSSGNSLPERLSGFVNWGFFWFVVICVAAGIFFSNGINALLVAWQLPEYSHGPLIPVLSGLLFLRQIKEIPVDVTSARNRWPGVILIAFSILFGGLGILANIDDIVAYAMILWVGGVLLVSWGWTTGKHFWPGVLHLVYMLPLPGVIYFKVTTSLQFISSELGVWFLRLVDVPVFLDGNIIDLGVLKLHVAEACSGLRYMFPIMSFSYIFATLYRGPVWHKLVLLLAAVPIAIVMNSIRIAVAGIIVQYYGSSWLDGFTHFFEGWVIFLACIVILFGVAWLMVFLRRDKVSLTEALDLEVSGLGTQMMRVRHVQASSAMVLSSVICLMAVVGLQALPDRGGIVPERDSFALFPRTIGDWRQQGPRQLLSPGIENVLSADDYHQVTLAKEGVAQPVSLFMAWYYDQSENGVHSPEVCLPGGGWEIAWLERSDMTEVMQSEHPFKINRAIIQKGETRMMVYYWFQQRQRKIAWDFTAKYWLMIDGIMTGRTDGALVRLTTPLQQNETEEAADARLMEVLQGLQDPLPRFIPET